MTDYTADPFRDACRVYNKNQQLRLYLQGHLYLRLQLEIAIEAKDIFGLCRTLLAILALPDTDENSATAHNISHIAQKSQSTAAKLAAPMVDTPASPITTNSTSNQHSSAKSIAQKMAHLLFVSDPIDGTKHPVIDYTQYLQLITLIADNHQDKAQARSKTSHLFDLLHSHRIHPIAQRLQQSIGSIVDAAKNCQPYNNQNASVAELMLRMIINDDPACLSELLTRAETNLKASHFTADFPLTCSYALIDFIHANLWPAQSESDYIEKYSDNFKAALKSYIDALLSKDPNLAVRLNKYTVMVQFAHKCSVAKTTTIPRTNKHATTTDGKKEESPEQPKQSHTVLADSDAQEPHSLMRPQATKVTLTEQHILQKNQLIQAINVCSMDELAELIVYTQKPAFLNEPLKTIIATAIIKRAEVLQADLMRTLNAAPHINNTKLLTYLYLRFSKEGFNTTNISVEHRHFDYFTKAKKLYITSEEYQVLDDELKHNLFAQMVDVLCLYMRSAQNLENDKSQDSIKLMLGLWTAEQLSPQLGYQRQGYLQRLHNILLASMPFESFNSSIIGALVRIFNSKNKRRNAPLTASANTSQDPIDRVVPGLAKFWDDFFNFKHKQMSKTAQGSFLLQCKNQLPSIAYRKLLLIAVKERQYTLSDTQLADICEPVDDITTQLYDWYIDKQQWEDAYELATVAYFMSAKHYKRAALQVNADKMATWSQRQDVIFSHHTDITTTETQTSSELNTQARTAASSATTAQSSSEKNNGHEPEKRLGNYWRDKRVQSSLADHPLEYLEYVDNFASSVNNLLHKLQQDAKASLDAIKQTLRHLKNWPLWRIGYDQSFAPAYKALLLEIAVLRYGLLLMRNKSKNQVKGESANNSNSAEIAQCEALIIAGVEKWQLPHQYSLTAPGRLDEFIAKIIPCDPVHVKLVILTEIIRAHRKEAFEAIQGPIDESNMSNCHDVASLPRGSEKNPTQQKWNILLHVALTHLALMGNDDKTCMKIQRICADYYIALLETGITVNFNIKISPFTYLGKNYKCSTESILSIQEACIYTAATKVSGTDSDVSWLVFMIENLDRIVEADRTTFIAGAYNAQDRLNNITGLLLGIYTNINQLRKSSGKTDVQQQHLAIYQQLKQKLLDKISQVMARVMPTSAQQKTLELCLTINMSNAQILTAINSEDLTNLFRLAALEYTGGLPQTTLAQLLQTTLAQLLQTTDASKKWALSTKRIKANSRSLNITDIILLKVAAPDFYSQVYSTCIPKAVDRGDSGDEDTQQAHEVADQDKLRALNQDGSDNVDVAKLPLSLMLHFIDKDDRQALELSLFVIGHANTTEASGKQNNVNTQGVISTSEFAQLLRYTLEQQKHSLFSCLLKLVNCPRDILNDIIKDILKKFQDTLNSSDNHYAVITLATQYFPYAYSLISAGADPNVHARNNIRLRLLSIAIITGKPAFVRHLLQRGAKPYFYHSSSIVYEQKDHALFVSSLVMLYVNGGITRKNRTEILHILIRHGAILPYYINSKSLDERRALVDKHVPLIRENFSNINGEGSNMLLPEDNKIFSAIVNFYQLFLSNTELNANSRHKILWEFMTIASQSLSGDTSLFNEIVLATLLRRNKHPIEYASCHLQDILHDNSDTQDSDKHKSSQLGNTKLQQSSTDDAQRNYAKRYHDFVVSLTAFLHHYENTAKQSNTSAPNIKPEIYFELGRLYEHGYDDTFSIKRDLKLAISLYESGWEHINEDIRSNYLENPTNKENPSIVDSLYKRMKSVAKELIATFKQALENDYPKASQDGLKGAILQHLSQSTGNADSDNMDDYKQYQDLISLLVMKKREFDGSYKLMKYWETKVNNEPDPEVLLNHLQLSRAIQPRQQRTASAGIPRAASAPEIIERRRQSGYTG